MDKRWLSPEHAAEYVGRRVDELPRLVRAGKMPRPSFHFGPRSPRYDRLALDALFTVAQAQRSIDQAEQDALDAITRRAREGRSSQARRRIG